MTTPEQGVGEHYARIRQRLSKTMSELSPAELATAVPACPGWRVRDVLSHLVGVVQDGVAGRLQGPPDEVMTAEQVERHRDTPIEELVAEWERLAPLFEPAISEMQAWPAALDALSHEFDVCHALGLTGVRDDPLIAVMTPMLAARLAGLAEVILDGTLCATTPSSPVQLRVSSFEFLRVAMGRRTLDQIAALDWTGDATAAVSRVYVFGPAAEPIVE